MASSGTGGAKAALTRPQSNLRGEGHSGALGACVGGRFSQTPGAAGPGFLRATGLLANCGFSGVSHAPANGTSTRPRPQRQRGVLGELYRVSNNFYLQHDAVPPSRLGTAQHSSQPGAPPFPQASRPGDFPHSEPHLQEAKPLSGWSKGPASSGEQGVKWSSPAGHRTWRAQAQAGTEVAEPDGPFWGSTVSQLLSQRDALSPLFPLGAL